MRKHKNYQQAFELACRDIQSLDSSVMTARTGAVTRQTNRHTEITLTFLGASYTVTLPQVEIASAEKKTISLVTRVMLLHYLIRADGTPEKGDLIPYKEIPGGLMYAGVFERRMVTPLLDAFGQGPERFLQAGMAMGGEAAAFGDVSFSVRVLPRVSVTLVLWKGDEEFPPWIQVLFDRSIDRYLSLEDIVVLGEMISKRLIARGSR
jgi:hypothetical protein